MSLLTELFSVEEFEDSAIPHSILDILDDLTLLFLQLIVVNELIDLFNHLFIATLDPLYLIIIISLSQLLLNLLLIQHTDDILLLLIVNVVSNYA
jgi:hypothetical protein